MNQAWVRLLPLFLRSKVEGRAYLQNALANTGWQFADHILRMGVGLLVGIWLARYLGPEQFGMLSYALAFVALFAPIAHLGLDDIIVRDVVRSPEQKEEILGTAFFLRLGGGAGAFFAAAVSITLLRTDDLSRSLVLIVAAGALFQAFHVIEFWFHSQVKVKYAIWARNTAFLLASLVKVILILQGAPLIAFAWVALFEIALGAAGLVLAYLARGDRLRDWRLRGGKAWRLLQDTWPLMLSGMVIAIYLRIDQVMLGELAGNEEVGVYSVAVRLAEVWLFIPAAIYWSVFPSVVEAKELGAELFYGRLQKLYNLMAFSAYAVALPAALLAQWLVPALFGEAYGRGGPMLAVLVWANIFISLEMARSAFLTAMNWTRIYLLTVSLGCVLNIVLNFYLIPLYGGMGAVVASLLAYWFAAHGSCFLFKPLFRTGAMLSKALVYPKFW